MWAMRLIAQSCPTLCDPMDYSRQAPLSWIMEKSREFQKNIYFRFIDYAKAFDCGSQ